MKPTPWLQAEPHRLHSKNLPVQHYGDPYGAFLIPGPCGRDLKCIVSSDLGWDHVSISLENRCPNWQEMEFIKRVFFKDDEWAMQLHAPPSKHISVHPYCLHIWRPHDKEIPIPPPEFIA